MVLVMITMYLHINRVMQTALLPLLFCFIFRNISLAAQLHSLPIALCAHHGHLPATFWRSLVAFVLAIDLCSSLKAFIWYERTAATSFATGFFQSSLNRKPHGRWQVAPPASASRSSSHRANVMSSSLLLEFTVRGHHLNVPFVIANPTLPIHPRSSPLSWVLFFFFLIFCNLF